MEKGFDSWFQDQQMDWNSPNLNLLSAQFGLGPRVTMVSPPVREEPHGWFYGLPRYRQGLVPVVNSIAKEVKPQLAVANGVQKKFLVFDQSGDQTTLIYSLGLGAAPTRYHFPSVNDPYPQSGSHPVHVSEYIKENEDDDSRSEMREDTEELNALLYSDNDDDDDDDDEMSTGHSPSSRTGGPTKKRKRENEGKIVNSLEDTASSSGKSGINCSGNEEIGVFGKESDNCSSGNKRLRKEKMKETINLLRNLIPGIKDCESGVMVIDEAIHYLKNLKVKAKALGLDSL